ncbi:hypothetical protein DFH27DRAFT_24358 [Peziza echinospora]|nr:hypothetical protein DFH27DRAFT_24358 [Peziza echinospora]
MALESFSNCAPHCCLDLPEDLAIAYWCFLLRFVPLVPSSTALRLIVKTFAEQTIGSADNLHLLERNEKDLRKHRAEKHGATWKITVGCELGARTWPHPSPVLPDALLCAAQSITLRCSLSTGQVETTEGPLKTGLGGYRGRCAEMLAGMRIATSTFGIARGPENFLGLHGDSTLQATSYQRQQFIHGFDATRVQEIKSLPSCSIMCWVDASLRIGCDFPPQGTL